MKVLSGTVLAASIFSVCMGGTVITTVSLPEPVFDHGYTVSEAILARRSVRSFTSHGVTLCELSRLLESAQGITSGWGFRAAPSAGATFPFSVLVVAENVEELNSGIYLYLPRDESLLLIREGEFLAQLSMAAHGQPCIACAPLVLVIAAEYSITTDVYGERGITYVHMEAGHISQNIYLQCTALELGTVAVGAFEDDEVSDILLLGEDRIPLYLMPVGRPSG